MSLKSRGKDILDLAKSVRRAARKVRWSAWKADRWKSYAERKKDRHAAEKYIQVAGDLHKQIVKCAELMNTMRVELNELGKKLGEKK
ncbi:MAG TPA: hypothetical protein VJK72_05735 [Candidatus Nanoarchaeia archaeon]|nr:hypothetical protein [Candidatus Nanoarchaeia archaeon]